MVKRKVISIIISALILFAALTSLTMSLIELKKQNDIQPKAYWDFSKGVLSPYDTTNYENNTDFFIDTQQAFFNFRDSVARGCTFEQKRVVLELDIDLSGKNWYPIGCNSNGTFLTDFKGTFNGQNNTISNMTCTYSYNDDNFMFGLFAFCDANMYWGENPSGFYTIYPKISNLKLSNPKIDISNKSSYLIGSLSAIIGGDYVIENVCVDGLTISTTGDGGETAVTTSVGGLFGYCPTNNSNIQIKNCYVNYSKLNLEHQQQFCYYAGIGPAELQGSASDADVTITNCVVKHSGTYNISWEDWKYVANEHIIYDYACNMSTQQDPATILDSQGQAVVIYSQKNVITLNPGNNSSASTVDSSFNNSYWFYDAKYNGGYPILKAWLIRQTYYFSINNPNAWEGLSLETLGEGWSYFSYYNRYEIEVPNDALITVKDATVEILSRSITAKSSKDYIACTGWTKDSNYYYANFGLRTFTVNFELASGAQASYNEYTSLTVLYGEKITVARYANADYKFYYEFTVTNDSGSKVWTKCFMNDRKYELKDWDTLESKTWTITEDTTITLDTTEKEYGSVWQ